MTSRKMIRRAPVGTALAALALCLGSVAVATPALAQSRAARPSETLTLSQNTGTLVRLSSPMSDVFIANDSIADVQVRSSTQLYVFGKSSGETTVYATDKSGRVVYAANVRVGTNAGSVGEMLRLAMPEASIQATPMNNLVLLTGTVSSPNDVEEAQRLVQAYVGTGTQVVSRLRSATPLQVMLKVKIAEVNRSLVKSIGVNLLSRDRGGGTLFGIGQGNPGTIGTPSTPTVPGTPTVFNTITNGTSLGLFGRVLGLDVLGTLDLAENDGLVSTLAEPNLTALSGETASFLAGGEFPIPISQSLGAVTIEYKQYGVGLAFTPYVLADGRISMRVRPEVSELSNEGSIRLNGYDVPALTTRRAETTVELGSGQSFMIAGLLRNANTNNISKAPFLGDLPILGALFRSTSYRRAETELVIIVTPYLVRPTSGQLALPTDGYRAPNTADMVLGGQTFQGVSAPRPVAVAPAPAITGTATTAAASPGFKL
ncbi:type II and III secretion system protein family protein [Sphingomonas sp. LY29]|uniref:type II and III secretion system protein family protein n=1 Tax=Sphingomonas sp. LY29 TaxID=3095341 RepID=UPI002D799A41|nr:type II and III secretion system protein family protein [Sphingomonas sp. LY29]WRP25837.1 type II and III secretion system protein family protein [Sphingomonas sp. LY29]